MEKDILKTGSFGLLVSNKTGKHYLQLICEHGGDTHYYISEITKGAAESISDKCKVTMSRVMEVGDFGLNISAKK